MKSTTLWIGAAALAAAAALAPARADTSLDTVKLRRKQWASLGCARQGQRQRTDVAL